MVNIPLSLNPNMKQSIIKFHFLWQNTPSTLTTQSTISTSKRVVLKPFLSPMQPQKGAPKMAETVRVTEQKARKWSSLRIGMKMSFMYSDMQMRQSGQRKEMLKRIINFLSLRVAFKRVLMLLGCSLSSLFCIASNFYADSLPFWFSLLSGTLISSANFSVFLLTLSSLFSTSSDPTKKQAPLHTNITFDALKTLSEISFLKNAWLCSSISASQFLGLTSARKVKFQIIMPRAKNKTAEPETLLRSFGN